MTEAGSIRSYMISCAERHVICRETLARYAASDLESIPLTVVLDTEAIEAQGLQVERKQTRQELVSRFALEQAIESGVSYILFLEDDLDFNLHTRHNLFLWEPFVLRKVTLAGLYHPTIREIEQGRHYFVADPETIYGSQAFLISSACIMFILEHWDEQPGMQDIKFSRLAARMGQPLYYHSPSLVQHVGKESTWGGWHHTAADFEKDFRAVPQ